jgi:hypothetical protein
VNHEDELRERFAAWRREDAMRAPNFDRLSRAGARRVARAGTLLRPWLTAAAGVTLAVVVTWVSRSEWHERDVRRSLQAMPLADWHSPTDFLLETPASPLLRDVPRIGDPRFNAVTPTHRRTQERST